MAEPLTVKQMLFTQRAILVALIWGVGTFAVLVVFVIRPTPEASAEKIFLATLAALITVEVIAWVVVRRVWTGRLRRSFGGTQVEEDEPLILKSFWALGFIGAAMTEAASLFAVVIHMISASKPALFVAGVGILLLLIQLPTRDRYRGFVARISGRRPV